MNASSYNKNVSQNDTGIMKPEKNNEKLLLVAAATNVLVSTICLLYITLKLKLNKYIKTILVIMAIQGIIYSSIMSVTNAIVIFSNEKTFLICLSITQSEIVLLRSNVTMTSLISILRFSMASRASKAKFVKEKYVFSAIIFAIVFPYSNILGFFIFNGGYNKGIYLCLDSPAHEHQFSVVHLTLNFGSFFLTLVIGIFFDLKMVAFVKHRNRLQPVELVPWKSTTEEVEKDTDIPVRATLNSTFWAIFFLVMFAVFILLDMTKDYPVYILVLLSFMIICIIQLPLLLFLTIKQKSNQKIKVQPPQKLQFHNENFSHPLQYHEDFDESGEDVGGYNERNVIVHDEKSSTISKCEENLNATSPKNEQHLLDASKLLQRHTYHQHFDRIDVQSLTEIEC